MDISYILLIFFAVLFIFSLVCIGYLSVYKRYINIVLTEPDKKHIKLMPPYKVLLILIILLAVIGTSFAVSVIPDRKHLSTVNDIEKEVRGSQEISDDWNIEIAVNDRIAAVIAYDSQESEHHFFIYENKGNKNANYVFRYGGKSTSIERGIRVFQFEGAIAFLSMNTLHIAAIECHDGERYDVDPHAPFAVVIPSGGYGIYDENGRLIDITQAGWYELTEKEQHPYDTALPSHPIFPCFQTVPKPRCCFPCRAGNICPSG